MQAIRNFFKIDERGSSIKVEVLAGISTFLTMMYILPVNADMLSTFTPELYGQFFLATAVAAIVATLIMGIYANLPIGLAPGMGTNAFFTFTVVLTLMDSHGYAPIEAIGFALTTVFISGVLFVILSVTSLREKLIAAIPSGLYSAIGAGIGFFIAFLGLQNAGLIINSEATLVTFATFNNPVVVMTFIGILIGVVLMARGFKFAVIVTMTIAAVSGLFLGILFPGYANTGEGLEFVDIGSITFTSLSDLGLSEIFGLCFQSVGDVLTSSIGWFAIFTFLFVDFFDTTGTLIAVGSAANLLDSDGNLENGNKALLADSIGTVAGSIVGVSSTTSLVESVTGVESGARTGLSAVVIALLFILAIPLYPIFAIYNQPVTSIALILVGVSMVKQLRDIDWSDEIIAISSFFIISIILLSYSIYVGIAVGFIVYSVLNIFTGKAKELSPVMYGIALISVAYFVSSAIML